MLSSGNPGVSLDPSVVRLYNGVGSALVSITGGEDFTLEAAISSLAAQQAVACVDTQAIRTVGGSLPGTNVTWSGTVRVTNDLLIAGDQVLTLLPGTLVLLDGVANGTNGVDIEVAGSIQSLGTAEHPVTFTATDPTLAWGEIRHSDALTSVYRHTRVTRAGHSPDVGHTGTGPAFRLTGSAVSFFDCVISDLDGKVMYATAGNDLVFSNCVLSRATTGPEVDNTALIATDTWITEMFGPNDNDGIYLHSQLPGQELALYDCVIADGDDDALDTLRARVTARNLILRDFADRGVTTYGGTVTLQGCLITGNGVGVATKEINSNVAQVNVSHCTIRGNGVGMYAYDKFDEPDVRILFFVTNSIIESGNAGVDAIVTDYDPADILITYSDLGEPWPGVANTTNAAVFLNPGDSNYRLCDGSGCIDSGTNESWTATAEDLDGTARRKGAGPDCGCYEHGALHVDFAAFPAEGILPLPVTFDAMVCGSITGTLYYTWDFEDDGAPDALGAELSVVTNIYTNAGNYDVLLTVSNAAGVVARARRSSVVTAGWSRETIYVSKTGADIYPYTTWGNAARRIQSAVDAALANAVVLVSNGIYISTSEILVDHPLTLRSVNGPNVTVIDGADAARCLNITHAGSVVSGFTLQNGQAVDAGGARLAAGTVLRNSVVRNNRATGSGTTADGGGVYLDGGGLLENCRISGNSASDDGGGIMLYFGGTVRNCLVVSNTAADKGGAMYVWNNGTVENCTVVDNDGGTGDGVYTREGGTLLNTIIYGNGSADIMAVGSGQIYSNCCATSLPATSGNINSPPLFYDAGFGDYRLSSNSPCVDVAASLIAVTNDLNSIPRPLDGDGTNGPAPDIGAFEFASASVDADGDGMSDAHEVIAGTRIDSAASVLSVTEIHDGAIGMLAIGWPGIADRQYRLDRATNLPGAWSAVSGLVSQASVDAPMVFTNVPQGSPRAFYRIGVEHVLPSTDP